MPGALKSADRHGDLPSIGSVSYYRVTGVRGMFAVCYGVLILYTGCSRLADLSEAVATPLIPIILILSGWLSRVLFGAVV